jgi:actin related protein 2/3 complex subunit 1A/1B
MDRLHPTHVEPPLPSISSNRPAPSPWGEKLPFNTICGEFSSGTGGWIHSVTFSPSGNVLAFTGHDSTISIADPANGAIQSVRATTLPYLSILWLNENQIVAAGHDCAPHLFENKGQWYGHDHAKDISLPHHVIMLPHTKNNHHFITFFL